MSRHTPQIRLQAARYALNAAREICPHWDMESDESSGCECCYKLDEAKRELRLAKRQTEKQP